MKKILLPLLVSVIGLALLLLNGVFGSWMDRMLFDNEIRLSEAFSHLEKGEMEAHEKSLADYVLAGGGAKPLRALALYNLGNCALARANRGDPVAAKDALFYFKEALRNDPLLFPAKFNLEILIRSQNDNEKAGGDPKSGSGEQSKEEDEGRQEKQLVFPPPFLGPSP